MDEIAAPSPRVLPAERWTTWLYERYSGRRPWSLARRWRDLQWARRDEIDEQVLVRLRALLNHAERSVPYYRELFASAGFTASNVERLQDLGRIPTSTKSRLRTVPLDRLLSTDVPRWRAERHRTGGSTGRPFEFQGDRRGAGLHLANFLLFRGWAGAAGNDLRLHVASPVHFQSRPSALERRLRRWSAVEPVEFVRGVGLSADELVRWVERVSRRRRWYLWTYPSFAVHLAHELERRDLNLATPPVTVVSYAESLTAPDRAMISRIFGAPVFDLYSSMEVSLLAMTCPDRPGVMHVNPLRAIVRVVREDGVDAAPGEAGRVVVTDLDNMVAPLVNYELEDLATVGEACSCGRGFPTLAGVSGRIAERIETPDGRTLSAAMLAGIVAMACRSADEVDEFQAVVSRNDEMILRLVPGPGFGDGTVQRLKTALGDALGPAMRIAVERTSAIPRGPSEKRRLIVHSS